MCVDSEEVDQKKLEVHNLRLSTASLLQWNDKDNKLDLSPVTGGPITILQSRLKVSQVHYCVIIIR